QAEGRVRRRPAARSPLAPAGLLRHGARPRHLQRPPALDASPARSQRPRAAGDAGPLGILGAPLPGGAARADAQVPAASVAGERRDRGPAAAEVSESRAAPEVSAPAPPRPSRAARAEIPHPLNSAARA